MSTETQQPESNRSFEDRRPTTSQCRAIIQLVEKMRPGETLVFKFDGCNVREIVSDAKIAPRARPMSEC